MFIHARNKYEDCDHELTSDFSYYENFGDTEKTKHIYCHDCKAHWLKDKTWTKEEWEEWINKDEDDNC